MGYQNRKAVIYARVSTVDQNCDRQIRDLTQFAERVGCEVVGTFRETVSGAKVDRVERKKVMALAQAREIDCILVTELTRWGRSTIDLIETLQTLQSWNVSLIAQTGIQFDLSTPQGKLIAGVMALLAEFERDLTRERIRSGIANAKARGKKFGRQPGQNPSDKYLSRVRKLRAEGVSNLAIARQLGISKNTVTAICKRHSL